MEVVMSQHGTYGSQESELKTDSIDREQLLRMYEMMLRIRAFEQHVNLLYTSAKMPGLAHLYVGEEAIAVGVCEALRKDDYVTSTHRGHGHCLAKGATPDRMFAELLGKEAGYCRGKGGSMHIADTTTGNLGANGIVGGSFGIATGAALSARMRRSGQVVVCFFGDGAVAEGVLYEVMNMASLWSLPVLYVCENNLYGEYTAAADVIAGDILGRPRAFNLHAEAVDGQDVLAVYAAASRLVKQIRNGHGPSFLLCNTYRFTGHHVGDIDRTFYRAKDEEREWIEKRDPLKILVARLVETEEDSQGTLDEIAVRIDAEIEAAVKFALETPYPDPSEVDKHVYA
jgi:TPP-dependent pyruvate/acetoin dehydrogenase alpha subunit